MPPLISYDERMPILPLGRELNIRFQALHMLINKLYEPSQSFYEEGPRGAATAFIFQGTYFNKAKRSYNEIEQANEKDTNRNNTTMAKIRETVTVVVLQCLMSNVFLAMTVGK